MTAQLMKPGQTVATSRDARSAYQGKLSTLSDAEFWRYHLGADIEIVWVDRPDAGFRMFGLGRAIAIFTTAIPAFLLLAFLSKIKPEAYIAAVGVVLAVAGIGSLFGYLICKLDQHNRAARRHLITRDSVHAVRNADQDRPRSAVLSPATKVLTAEEKNRDQMVIALANYDDQGNMTETVQFERLSDVQMQEVSKILAGLGVRF